MINESWLIRGYNSTTLIYEKTLPLATFSERQVRSLLQALTAKAGLTNDEIIGAYARRGSKLHTGLLDVSKDGPKCKFSCGSNPFFTARSTSRI
jgi:hypothetical protein